MPAHFANFAREDRWDAVVIGAGPAGATAARQLAIGGKQVLLVDKARLPRDKVCGGCLGGAALEVLAAVGLADLPARYGSISLTTLVLANDGAVATVPIGRREAISRRTFDDALVREAVRAGVTVRDDTTGALPPTRSGGPRTVILHHRGEDSAALADVVIVATGLGACPGGFHARRSRASYIGLGAMVSQRPCDWKSAALHMACGADGYVGMTEVDDGGFEIAAAVSPRALANEKLPGRLVARILQQAGFDTELDLQAVEWRGTPPLSQRTTSLASHRCLLIGDAAGYVEPFTGEGIGWAMQSAVLATSLLAGALATWDADIEARWMSIYQSKLASQQRLCRVVAAALRMRTIRRLVMWGLRRAPSLSNPIVARLDRAPCLPTRGCSQ